MTAAQRIRSLWPKLFLISAAATAALVYGGVHSGVRLPVVLWFLLVCPGTALVRLLDLEDLLAEITVGVAVSAALAIIVSGVMLYAGAWSPNATLAVLLGITIFATVVDMRRGRSSVHQVGDSA
jgi:hypothetical protein